MLQLHLLLTGHLSLAQSAPLASQGTPPPGPTPVRERGGGGGRAGGGGGVGGVQAEGHRKALVVINYINFHITVLIILPPGYAVFALFLSLILTRGCARNGCR